MKELVYQAAARARLAPAIPSVKARRPGMYMPATAMPLIARQISAGKQAVAESNAEARQRIQCATGEKDRAGRHTISEGNQRQHGRHVAGGHYTGEPAGLGVTQRPGRDELRQQSGDQREASQSKDFRRAYERDEACLSTHLPCAPRCAAAAPDRLPDIGHAACQCKLDNAFAPGGVHSSRGRGRKKCWLA